MDDASRPFLEATLPHLDFVYRVARHTCGDHDRAEDLVQETYLRAFAAYRPGAVQNTKAWLITICLNLARSEMRRRSRRLVETALTEAHERHAAASSVAEEALSNLDREIVSAALSRLPEDQRTAIVLMDLAGLSASEVGEALGRSRNTVLSWVHRGRQRLSRDLLEEYVDRDLS